MSESAECLSAFFCSDRCAFFLQGELVEAGETERMFARPGDRRTEDYITGRFG